MVESTREDLKLTAPLTAITAAVLALLLLRHALFPNSSGRVDAVSAAILALAIAALLRFKIGVLPVIGACALAGLAVFLSWIAQMRIPEILAFTTQMGFIQNLPRHRQQSLSRPPMPEAERVRAAVRVTATPPVGVAVTDKVGPGDGSHQGRVAWQRP